MIIKIKDLPNGVIVWRRGAILGIKGATLDNKYYDNFCYKVQGNEFDYEYSEG